MAPSRRSSRALDSEPRGVLIAPARRGDRSLLLAGCLGLAVLLTFLPSLNHGFINFDDPDYITSNAQVQGGLTWANVRWAFSSDAAANWHPVTWLSHMFDCQIYGLAPWGHHLTNIVLHAASAMLLFLLFKRMTGATTPSLLVAGLFALHPLRVESVAWAAERKDVLSTFFGILSLWMYIRWTESRKTSGAPRWLTYGLSLGFFALSLMSKPMLVTMPVILLLVDYWPLGRLAPANPVASVISRVLEKVPYFLMAMASSVVTVIAQKHGGALQATIALSPLARIGNTFVSYCRYLGKFVWPVHLSVFYPHPGYWPALAVWLAFGFLAVITLLAFRWRTRRPYFVFGWLFFLVTLLPTIGLVQVGTQSMADRYTYVPTIGIAVIVAWGLAELGQRWKPSYLTAALPILLLGLCAGATVRQQSYWVNSETLFRHALEVTEHNSLAHLNLGVALADEDKLDEAIPHFREAARIEPSFGDARLNLGIALDNTGKTLEGLTELEEGMRLSPKLAKGHLGLGIVYYKLQRLSEASSEFQRAIALDPTDSKTHNNLGLVLAALGQQSQAVSEFEHALRLQSEFPEAHFNLANQLRQSGRMEEAILHFAEAVRCKPDYVEARNNLGSVLYAAGKLDDAIVQFQEAVRLRPDYVSARNNLTTLLKVRAEKAKP